MVWSLSTTLEATKAVMHVLGLYNLALALGVAGACSVCAPVSIHDPIGVADRIGQFDSAGGYWAHIEYGATTKRRVYFPAARERDPARRPGARDTTEAP